MSKDEANNSQTWTIENIVVNDIENDLMIKYESNEYWQNLELSKDFSKIVLITNKSMKQIENYKILIDILYTNDNKLETKFDIFFNSVNEILKEMKLVSSESIN